MDQRKPAAQAPAPEMSRRGAGAPDSADRSAPRASAPAPAVDQLISRQLKAIYDEVVNEPIPDRFLRLLQELERKKEGERDGGGES